MSGLPLLNEYDYTWRNWLACCLGSILVAPYISRRLVLLEHELGDSMQKPARVGVAVTTYRSIHQVGPERPVVGLQRAL